MAYYLISIEQKRQLSALLARRKGGHGQFGRVLIRKPYREDDEEGGSGRGLPSPFEQHPLLSQQPIGAPSDLTAVVSDRGQDMIDEAANRGEHDLSLQLQQKPQLQAALQQSHIATPKPR